MEDDFSKLSMDELVARYQKSELTLVSFAEWIRDNVEIKPINNFMKGYYLNGNVIKIEELIAKFDEETQINSPKQ